MKKRNQKKRLFNRLLNQRLLKKRKRITLNLFHHPHSSSMITRLSLLTIQIKVEKVSLKHIRISTGKVGHIGSSITKNSERRVLFFSLLTILLPVSFLELNTHLNILSPDTVYSVKSQTLRLWEFGYVEDQKKFQMVL